MRRMISLLLALLMLFACTALAEEKTEEPMENTPENFFTLLMQNLQTDVYDELPEIIRGRIDEEGWAKFTGILKDMDWDAILEAVKGFFSEEEWPKMDSMITGLFTTLKSLGISDLSSLALMLKNMDMTGLGANAVTSVNIMGLPEGLGNALDSIGGTVTDVQIAK